MSAAVCPYCRAPIEPGEEPSILCPGCGTPHHADCFEENGGCTVFGCSAAPAAEPKLSIAAPDLQGAGIAGVTPPSPPVAAIPPPPFVGSAGAAPPPPLVQAQATESPEGPPRFNSWGYSLLAHPLPEGEPPEEAPPLFSSLGYGAPRRTPRPVQPVLQPNPWAFDTRVSTRNRTAFLLLGVLLGAFGAHSFYAGSTKKGFLQLGITLLTFGFAGLMVWIWAVIDICTISTDHDGIPFRN